MVTALYPGSFDPPTLGHVDLVRRSVNLFDHVLVGVATNIGKNPVFTFDERVELLCHELQGLPVEVHAVPGLVVDFCRAHTVQVIVRGVRTVADFEGEYQMAVTNRALAPGVETLFLPPSPAFANVSSRLLKEIVRFGGDASQFVSPHVHERLLRKLREGA